MSSESRLPARSAGDKALRAIPQSLAAEAGALGSMIVAPDCIPDVLLQVQESDFYHPEHALIFRAIRDLYDQHNCEGVDGLLVRQYLQDRNLLEQIGGVDYLQRVTETVPSAANAAYYAQIVKDKADRRQIIFGCSDVLNAAYDDGVDQPELMDFAEKTLGGVCDRSLRTDNVVRTPDLLMDVYNAVEAREKAHKEGIVLGVPTGYYELDAMTGGFRGGDMIIVAGRPSMGKAQPLDALVLTPDGFTPMGLVRVRDDVIGADGKPHKVLGVFPQGTKQVYRVTFADGTSTECCGDHLWLTQTRNEKRFGGVWSVKTCDEIARTLVRPDGLGMNHRIPWVVPVEFSGSAGALPMDPYLLGLWLGDGCGGQGSVVISNPEPSIQTAIAETVPSTDVARVCGDGITNRVRRNDRTQQPSGMLLALRSLGLDSKHSYDKFIPRQYLHAPIHDRQQLLRGLLDTDGSIHSCGAGIEYCTASPQLAADVVYLARSLGAKVTMRQRATTYTYHGERRTGRIAYRLRIYFNNGFVPVSSRKHLARWSGWHRGGEKMIQSITPTQVKPCQCIMVDSNDGLYVTNDFIVTHNTAIVLNILEYAARVHGKGAVIYSLEMTRHQLMERVVCSLGEVDSHRVRTGTVTSQDYDKLKTACEQLRDANLFIDDTSSLTPFELRTRVRKLSRQHKIDLVAIDYVQLMHIAKRTESRQQEISEISRQMKALAKELNVPVILVSQLNRSPEGREDHRPRMSDLRESGCLAGDSLVTIADTGCRVPIASLVGKAGFRVWAYDTVQRGVAAARCSAVFPTGRKQVYVLRTRMGKEIRATANHQFYSEKGWVRLDELKPGDRIASYGAIPCPTRPTHDLAYDAIYLLGHVLGNGCLLPRHSGQYTTRHRDIADNVAACATRVFGSAVSPRIVYDNPRNQGGWYQVFFTSTRRHTHNVHSAVTEWARSLGIYGLRSREKFIPVDVFRMDNEHVAAFLAALWETDGTFGVSTLGKKQRAYASYCTSSLRLARDLAHLMLRIGVLCSIRTVRQKNNHRDIYHVQVVGGAASLLRFFDQVRFQSEYHRSRADQVMHRLASVRGYSTTTYAAEQGICWEAVASIEDAGVQECFDMTVPGYHNMEVESLVVHNSLEQDADAVILLHREDYYHRGEPGYSPTYLAEVIVAKQRNGPTGTVNLVFMQEFTKFTNRAAVQYATATQPADPF